jgi:hypothetical protein
MIHLTPPLDLALHMGALHPYEQALVALVAFGPFLVLFVVVYVVRRRDVAELEDGQSGEVPERGAADRDSAS